MTALRAVSLFSNCGAGDLGFRAAGFRFDVMAELDPRRLSVCLLNHPEAAGVPGDLRDTWGQVVREYRKKAQDERPALLCACPPCQGMSSARSGKGKHDDAAAGSKDERNLLVTVVANVALELLPAVIVVENVPAFLTRKVHHPEDGRPVSAANLLIAKLGKRYMPYAMTTDLCEFGVPQSRKRAFLTFIRRDLAVLPAFHARGLSPFPRASHGPGIRLPVPLEKALERLKLPSLDAASAETAFAKRYRGMHSVPVWDARTYAMVACIPAGTGKSAWDNEVCPICGPISVAENAATCPQCFALLLRPVLVARNGKPRLVRGFRTSYRRMHPNRPAATITTASGHLGSDFTIHPTENRLLSPLECALLQTFPRKFKWGNALRDWGATNVRDMIGEAVPPAFTRKHGEVLKHLLKGNFSRATTSSNVRCTKAWEKLREAATKDDRPDPAGLRELKVSAQQAHSRRA